MSMKSLLVGLAFLGSALMAQSSEVFPAGSAWRYFLGTREASDPVAAWRAPGYNDAQWSVGTAPIGFGEGAVVTTIPSSSNRRWQCVFFRKTFVLENPDHISQLKLSILIDDGYAVWVNGQRVGGYNVPDGELPFNATSFNPLPLGSIEPTLTTVAVTNDVRSLLFRGTNVVAVQGFNVSRSNGDFIFDASLSFTADVTAPVVAEVLPPTGAVLPGFTQIEVMFDENVTGVEAADLLVNGTPATGLTIVTDFQYVFEFAPPGHGAVEMAWRADHGIQDLANPANRFEGGSWKYTVDPNATPPGVIISEFAADNRRTLRDEDGDASDWIELYNAGYTPVNLSGWSLTTRTNNLRQWLFPEATLLANRYLLVFASGKDRTNSAAPLHASFRLNKDGDYLALVNPDGEIVSEFAPGYPGQLTDVSYGRLRDEPGTLAFFPEPTPGMPNKSGGPGFAPPVQFSISGRTFSSPFSLALATTSSLAVIHYTLSTNLPTESSPVYSGPIPITGSVHVRARAFEPRLLPGPIGSETYLSLASDLRSFHSDLPIVVLHNLGKGQVPASVDQFVAVQVFEPKAGASSLTNAPDLAISGIFHKRGRSTGGLPKASFFLETQDELGDDRSVSFAGLPSESDWVLYAPNVFDPVLIHNPMAHELMRQMGRYSPRTRFVEVYLKDDSGSPGPIAPADYNGVYVLEEKIKIGRNRVDIDKLRPENVTPPSLTGGYLFSIDSAPPGSRPFFGAGTPVNYLDPDYFEITTPQRSVQEQYVQQYFAEFDQALNGPNWTDPDRGYAAYIDVPAAIDHHLQGVLTFNVDALRLSGYFHKPRDGKIMMGPVWDFDRTQGSADGRDFNPRLWRSTVPDFGTDMFNSDFRIFSNPWYGRMFGDIDFWQKWIDRYQELRRDALRISNLHAAIDQLAAEVRQAQPREVARWQGSSGSDTTPRSGLRSSGGYSHTFPGTYQGEVDFMKRWYSNRLEFIDGQFLAPPTVDRASGNAAPGAQAALATLAGPPGATIYYTLDGTDPRLPGGTVSPSATAYSAPINLEANARLVARAHDLNHRNLTGPGNPQLSSPWSGPVESLFVVEPPPLVITEIMFEPPPSTPAASDGADFEFLELRNLSPAPLELAGFRLTNGVQFQFPSLTLAGGERVLVVANLAAFQTRYGTNLLVAGEYTGQLDNAGERLTLVGPLGEPILDFVYDNNWYPITRGFGFSLVIVNDQAPLDTWGSPSSWRPSAFGGSPGLADPPPALFPPVLVNEVLTRPGPGESDAVELYNSGDVPADISGWYLTDSFSEPAKYRFPSGTILGPGSFRVLTRSDLAAGVPAGFALSSLGEDIYLFSADAPGNLSGYVHGFPFGAAEIGVSFGRIVSSTGQEHFVAQAEPTLGSQNAGPRTGPVVINEIMFHPPPDPGAGNNTRDEFIELRNLSGQPLPLFASEAPTNTWSLRDGVTFAFPPNAVLPADSYVVVVGFDPAADPGSLAAFRARYSLAGNVPIFGPWSGLLENQGERIRLFKPDASRLNSTNDTAVVAQVLVDEVEYGTGLPWPANASATGNSLQRIDSTRFGNDPVNWQAAAPTPGAANTAGTPDSDGDGLPDSWEIAHGLDPSRADGDDGADGDPDGDGMTNLQEWLSGTDPRDPNSYLHLAAIQNSAEGIQLRFDASPGKTYSVLYRADINSGAWLKLIDVPASSETRELEVLDPAAGDPPQRYYQLTTPSIP